MGGEEAVHKVNIEVTTTRAELSTGTLTSLGPMKRRNDRYTTLKPTALGLTRGVVMSLGLTLTIA
jgi:hypothetical protein